MATFRVGQRVRIRADAQCEPHLEWLRGMETAIAGPGDVYGGWTLSVRDKDGCPIVANSDSLEPILPPDEWADAKVREVTKPTYLEPERVKETSQVKVIAVTTARYMVYPGTNIPPLVDRAGMVAELRELRAAAIAKGMRLLSLEEIRRLRK